MLIMKKWTDEYILKNFQRIPVLSGEKNTRVCSAKSAQLASGFEQVRHRSELFISRFEYSDNGSAYVPPGVRSSESLNRPVMIVDERTVVTNAGWYGDFDRLIKILRPSMRF